MANLPPQHTVASCSKFTSRTPACSCLLFVFSQGSQPSFLLPHTPPCTYVSMFPVVSLLQRFGVIHLFLSQSSLHCLHFSVPVEGRQHARAIWFVVRLGGLKRDPKSPSSVPAPQSPPPSATDHTHQIFGVVL